MKKQERNGIFGTLQQPPNISSYEYRVLWPSVFCSKSSQSDMGGKLGVLDVSRDGE